MDTKIFRDMSYGLYVVTAARDGGKQGCVVNTVFQITSEPARIAVSVNRGNYTNECIKATGEFAVSILAESVEMNLIAAFGFASSRDRDKFVGVDHKTVEGLPVLTEGSCGWMRCKVVGTQELNTHTVFFAEVLDSERYGGESPMTYAYYHQVKNGVTPPAAPSYVAPREETRAWTCPMCGYRYDGEVPFEDLPEDWVCPLCGVSKSEFVLK